VARFGLTDAEWALVEPFLPVAATGPLPRRPRAQLNGVLWRFRNGTGRRDVPERYRSWTGIYSLMSGDSTVVRAHHESAGLDTRALERSGK
jgi:transposase